MLALKTAKLSPLLLAANQGNSAPTVAVLNLISQWTAVRGYNDVSGSARPFILRQNFAVVGNNIWIVAPPLFPSLSSVRFYAEKSAKPVEPPQPPSLPSKDQVEKWFFRTVAFVWDVGLVLIAWSFKLFDQFIVKNQTVQFYYHKFLEKMAESKK